MTGMDSPNLHGFTFFELMVTLVIVALVTTVAIPVFSDLVRQQRLTAQANHFLAMLQLARSEAIQRGVRVTLQRCGDTDSRWEQGWQVYVDWNGDRQFDTDANSTSFCSNPDATISTECSPGADCLLRGYAALPNALTLRSGAALKTSFSFLPSGFIAPALGDSFHLCDPAASIDQPKFSRKITLNRRGNAKIQEGAVCPP